MIERQEEILDMQQQLQTRLWSGDYYAQGKPIVRLLGDLSIELARKIISEPDER